MDYEYLLCGNLLILAGGIVCWLLGRAIINSGSRNFRESGGLAQMQKESHEFQSREALKDLEKPLLCSRVMTQTEE